ncbi:MAG: ABC transporter ATP-binding protein [Spirochaetota bacterium]
MSLLRMDRITKVFPGVVANDEVSFDLEAGEVHALVGENGAGKTTLMKILYGLYKPDGGEISINDAPVEIGGPRDAISKGIGMVHQHFMLVPVFSVLDNVILGSEREVPGGTQEAAIAVEESADPLKRLLGKLSLDKRPARRRILELMERNRIDVDLDRPAGDLPVGIQQRVEILKILYRGASVLVFDEPTAVLSPQEIDSLFESFRELTDQGKGVVFISHKLDEVLRIADRITVIRRGAVVETMPREGATKAHIAQSMVGKPVILDVSNPPAEPGEPVLEIEGLSAVDERGTQVLDGVSLVVRAGEIVGIAGVEGNGQSELVFQITEDRRPTGGDIRLKGQSILSWDVRRRREGGIAHIPGDRHRYGLLMPFALSDNLVLGRHHRPPFVEKFGFRNTNAIRSFARETISAYDVRTPNETTPAHALSGGNQQKVIIAREMAGDPALLVASQPTRGVDIGATEFIYRQIVRAKKQGRAVLLVSADLDEVLALADRILVMYKGQIVFEADRKKATKEEIGYYMTGEADHETVSA